MAGMLPPDPSHHGINDMHNISHDKLEEADNSSSNWYFSRKSIEECSPSRKDGIDAKKETYFRKSYCTFLQDLGMRLKVPQVTIATAIIFCHRFFLRQSHAKNDRRTIATVCMFLAGKVEETPRPLKDVILISYEIIHKKDPAAVQKIKQKEVYEQQKELILLAERVVLATLGFDLNVHHPYKPLVEAIKKFKVAQNALAQVAWNFVNDGLRTSLCLQFKPHHIAAGAIFLAAKFLKVKLPSDGEKFWWQEFDVTPRQLEEVSNQMLELYEQNRAVPPSHGSEAEGGSVATVSANQPESSHPAFREDAVTNKYGTQARQSLQSSHAEQQSYPAGDKQSGPERGAQGQHIDQGNSRPRFGVYENKFDGIKDQSHHDTETFGGGHGQEEHTTDALHKPKMGAGGLAEETKRKDAHEQVEVKDEPAVYKFSNGIVEAGGGGGGGGEGKKDGGAEIHKIDKDRLKAAIEKRRKSRVDVNNIKPASIKKADTLDDDDLIRELESGVELAAEAEKVKQERKQAWSKSSLRSEETHKEHEYGSSDGTHKRSLVDDDQAQMRKRSRSLDSDEFDGNSYSVGPSVTEEGELSAVDVREIRSPKPGAQSSPLHARGAKRRKSPYGSREQSGYPDAKVTNHYAQHPAGYHQESHKEFSGKGYQEYNDKEHRRHKSEHLHPSPAAK